MTLSQQFRVQSAEAVVDTGGSIIQTAVTLAPLPGGTSTGTYTAAPTSDLTLILGGLVPATVGQVFTVSLA